MNEFEMIGEQEAPQEPLYTLEDYEKLPPSPQQPSPTLQALTTLATGVPSEGPIDRQQHIDQSYRVVAEKNQERDKSLAIEKAKTGEVDYVASLVSDMNKRNQELNAEYANEVARIREIAEAAYENVALNNIGVIYNNTPQQISSFVEKGAAKATVASTIEDWENKHGGFVKGALSFAQGFTPLGLTPNVAFGMETEKRAPGQSSKVFYGDNVRALRGVYSELKSEQERVDWLKSLFKDLSDSMSLTANESLDIVKLVTSEEELSSLTTIGETLAPIGAIPLVGTAFKSGKLLSAASKLEKTAKGIKAESAVANAGGKAQIIEAAASQMRRQATVGMLGEVTGFTAIQDIGKLVSIPVTKLLPDAITTAPGKVQEQVLNIVDDTLNKIKASVGVKNIRDDEIESAIAQITRTYDKSIDKTIHMVNIGRMEEDPLSVVATVLRGTQNADVFLTKQAVDEYIKLVDPDGKRGFTAVQDKANNTYKFSEETKKAIILERDAASARLLELQAQQGKVVAKPAPKVKAAEIISAAKLPKELSGARPNYAIGTNKFSLQFDNDIDKAAFITSQTKKSKRDADYVTWLKESTGWDDVKIAEHGQKVRDAIKASAKASEPGKLKVQNQVEQVQTKREVGTKEFWIASRFPEKREVGTKEFWSASRFPEKREAGTRNFWETARPIDNTEEINKLEAIVNLSNERLQSVKDIENGLSAGWLVEEKIKKSIDISAIGKFKEEDIQSMMRLSFGDLALGASQEVYQNRLIGVMAEASIRNSLIKMVEKPLQELTKKEKVLLNSVLVKGDKLGKVFNSVELRAEELVSDKAQAAYFAVRAARDLSWRIKDETAAKSFRLKGWKQVWHPALKDYEDELGGFKLFGKEVDNAATLNKSAFDPTTKETVRLTASKQEELANRGFKVIEFDTPIPLGGVDRRRIVVQAGGLDIREIRNVIPYRSGEFSRMYSDEYFVRLKGMKRIDDVDESVTITHRTAKNTVDANKYARAYNEMVDLYQAGKLDAQAAARMQAYGWEPSEVIRQIADNPTLRAEVNYTRTQDDYVSELTNYTRNFSSKRGEQIRDVEGNTTNILDPLDALAAEISNTAYVASHTEWMDVSIKRWFETAKDILPDLANLPPEQAFARYMRTKGTYVGSSQTERFIRRVADQIAEGMTINDKESRVVLGLMRSFTEGIDTLTDGKFEKAGIMMRQADPVSWAKTFSFHAVFGLNPVQLLVQGLNAVNAAIISPAHGLKAARSYAFYRAALTSDNPEVWKTISKTNKWASLGFGSEDEFLKTVNMINRSGLIANMSTSSLYGMNLGKYNLTSGFISKLADKSSFFFREGEEASRIVSFDIARREWMVKNPGKVWDSDEALREILVRQDILTGTMTNANAASWQKGLISIPLQFMQFPVKFALNIINGVVFNGKRNLTRKEAAKLIGGNVLLFGSAGLLGSNLGQSLFGEQVGQLPKEQQLALSQGLISSAIYAVTSSAEEEGAKLAIGERFSPFNIYRDTVSALFSEQDPGIFETFSGAFGGVFLRSIDSIKNISDLYRHDSDVSPEKLGETLKIMTMISSVGRNYFTGERAENLWNQKVSKGTAQYRIEDKELFFQKYLGISPVDAPTFYELSESNFNYQKRMKKDAERLNEIRTKSLEAYVKGDDTTGRMYSNIAEQMLASMSPRDRNEVNKQEKTLSGFTRLEELKAEYLFNNLENSQNKVFISD